MAYFTQLGPAFQILDQMLWLCAIFQGMIHWPMKETLQVQTELTQDLGFQLARCSTPIILEFNSMIAMCLYILYNFFCTKIKLSYFT